MTLRVDGLAQAQARLNALIAQLPEVGGAGVRAAGATLGAGMERRAPKLSGEWEDTLGRSVATTIVSDTSVEVGPQHGAADVFEYGGELTPRVREYLKFQGAGGEDVYAREVTVPAQPFVRPAVDEDSDAAGRAAAGAAAKRINRIV